MSDEVEWGPWVEHDGNGCPCRGKLVHGIERCGAEGGWIAGKVFVNGDGSTSLNTEIVPSICAWSWAVPGNVVSQEFHIIRYRIRKPRGLTILESLLENLPEEVDA